MAQQSGHGRKRRSSDGKSGSDHIYDDIAYRWQNVNDVSYPLDSADLRTMQKMENALDYILHNLGDMDVDLERCAAVAGYEVGYFERSFRRYYGLPFMRFLTKLRLREAARNIMHGMYAETAGKQFGFSTIQSFSKAFRREFGMSPHDFKRNGYEVPDMPFRHVIKGVPISLEYRSINAFRMNGLYVPPPDGQDTFLMDQNAFIFRKGFPVKDFPDMDLEAPNEQVGIWWHETDFGLEYLFGPVTERSDTTFMSSVPEGQGKMKTLTIQGGNYAILSFPRPEDSSRIFLMSRILARFISREWIPMNRKVRNSMGCTFFTFDSTRVCEYVPLAEGMGADESLRMSKWSIQSWADYIDQHITEDLTLESLAIASNYSSRNYRDVFSMYYGMTPAEYVTRRRLLLASEELSSGADEQVVMGRYRYRSRGQFDRDYKATFGDTTCEHAPKDAVLTDLMEYYAANKGRVKISFKVEQSRRVLMHSIEESSDSAIPDDLIGRMVYWFNHDFRDFIPIKALFAEPEEKLFVWSNDAVYEDSQMIYKYYEGVVLKSDLTQTDDELTAMTEGASEEELPGGRYAVFSTLSDDDTRLTEDAARLLTRCAFGGYINENRWRIDMQRRTFITWQNSKLYFHVPVVR